MAEFIELKKKFNHRWKSDPLFIKNFDYDHPKYAHIPDDQKWMLPMHEQQQSPEVLRYHADMDARAKARIEWEQRQERLKDFRELQTPHEK